MVASGQSQYDTDSAQLPPPATSSAPTCASWRLITRSRAQIILACMVIAAMIYQFQETILLTAIGYQQNFREAHQPPLADLPVEQLLQQLQKLEDLQQHGSSVVSSLELDTPASQMVRKPFVLPNLPRIFDVVLLNDELNWLEIRLNELDPVVDVFVVIESEETFQKHLKPLHFRLNEHIPMFARFSDRILHIIVPNITEAEIEHNRHNGGDAWTMETYLRNKGMEMAINTYRPSAGDWILHSDVDEIPRASLLAKLKVSPNSVTDRPIDLVNKQHWANSIRIECNFHYYSYEYKHKGSWVGPVISQFEEAPEGVDPTVDDDIQYTKDGVRIWNKSLWHDWPNAGSRMRSSRTWNMPMIPSGCWHCSWCFSNITMVYNKAASYSHSEHNNPHYMNEKSIVEHFREGTDLFNRGGEIYDYSPELDIPEYIARNPDKYSYMTHRYKVKNAGFLDVPLDGVDY
ncbi:hypothetical protein BGZ73_006235 [Actinomortierella ambigua]|nr:hypothetical protein BGZ73_006235 [Actinomortierella ambigua]